MANEVELPQIVCEGASGGPRLLITGGVHGDEFEPMAAIRRLAGRVTSETLAGTLTLAPVVNEPAFRRGSRTADDGLDLARVCPGDPLGSATQRIAHKLSELIRDADYYIDLHTGGSALSVYPLAGYMLHPDQQVREQQRAMARFFNLPLVWGTDPTLDGRSLSVARDANIPAIYVEYQGGGGCDAAGVEAMVEGCLNVMGYLEMLDRSPPPSRLVYDVQETHPESGFLQQSLPAPCSGFFETAVSLGDFVEEGQPIGWVVDATGRQRVAVPADKKGLVICLRTLPAVAVNDSLGYIIEIAEKTHE